MISPDREPTPARAARSAARRAEGNGGGSLSERVTELAESAFTSFVRGRSDEQLERVMGSGPAMRIAFSGMERAFVPEKSGGFEGAVQYELDGSRGLRRWNVAHRRATRPRQSGQGRRARR